MKISKVLLKRDTLDECRLGVLEESVCEECTNTKGLPEFEDNCVQNVCRERERERYGRASNTLNVVT